MISSLCFFFQSTCPNPNPSFISSVLYTSPSFVFVVPRSLKRREIVALVCAKKNKKVGRGRRIRVWEEGDAGLEENFGLESEILDFMLKSANPMAFPSKEELIAARRMDLVEKIAAQGGWLAYGWDFGEKDKEGEEEMEMNKVPESYDFATGNGWNSVEDEVGSGGFLNDDERMYQQRFSDDVVDSTASPSSSSSSSSYPPYVGSSGGLTEMEVERREDAGVEGILSRLERERMLSYAVESREKGGTDWNMGKDVEDDGRRFSVDKNAGSERSRSTSLTPGSDLWNGSMDTHSGNGALPGTDGIRSSTKPEMWRTWSIQRTGLLEDEFEAAEIVHYKSGNGKMTDHNLSREMASNDEMIVVPEVINGSRNIKRELPSSDKENYRNQIHSCLQHLEQELSSVLHLLRSRNDPVSSQKVQDTLLEELHKLTDAWEFQQTEIMKNRDKLRTTRAKLAVLEGKVALEIIEAQKMVKEKQKRIDSAKKALHVLQTVCIVWPNSASVVLLAGSFDGWTNQRRMERSNSGIFSLNLKLYPGRYEIKFIVDGVWTVDPLRPIVNNNGYENNLLIIS